jgi:uncharacterized protein (DUF983 family)
MPISALCKDIYFTDFGLMGKCFTEFVFFGQPDLIAFILIIMFGFIAVKAQLPLEAIYPAFMGLFFALWLMSGAVWLMGLFLLGLLLGGLMLGLKILESLGRT